MLATGSYGKFFLPHFRAATLLLAITGSWLLPAISTCADNYSTFFLLFFQEFIAPLKPERKKRENYLQKGEQGGSHRGTGEHKRYLQFLRA